MQRIALCHTSMSLVRSVSSRARGSQRRPQQRRERAVVVEDSYKESLKRLEDPRLEPLTNDEIDRRPWTLAQKKEYRKFKKMNTRALSNRVELKFRESGADRYFKIIFRIGLIWPCLSKVPVIT